MLLRLFAQLPQSLIGQKGGNEEKNATVADIAESRAHLYDLLCSVQREIARVEQIFNMAEDEALIDNSVYLLKSLQAQQQFLVQNLRRLEGVGIAHAVIDAETEETTSTDVLTREGYAMG